MNVLSCFSAVTHRNSCIWRTSEVIQWDDGNHSLPIQADQSELTGGNLLWNPAMCWLYHFQMWCYKDPSTHTRLSLHLPLWPVSLSHSAFISCPCSVSSLNYTGISHTWPVFVCVCVWTGVTGTLTSPSLKIIVCRVVTSESCRGEHVETEGERRSRIILNFMHFNAGTHNKRLTNAHTDTHMGHTDWETPASHVDINYEGFHCLKPLEVSKNRMLVGVTSSSRCSDVQVNSSNPWHQWQLFWSPNHQSDGYSECLSH